MPAEQYIIGTASVTNGSQTVTGVDTAWYTEIEVGAAFKVDDEREVFYQVAAIVSDTELTLSSEYAGVTGTGKDYIINRSFTPNFGMPRPQQGDLRLADILRSAIDIIDNNMIANNNPIPTPSYTVAGAPDATAYEGTLIFVSDETGGATTAFSDGTNWLRVYDKAIISA